MEKGFAFFLSMILLALTGCGDKVALSGKVTYSDDGSPLPIGTVFFAGCALPAETSSENIMAFIKTVRNRSLL